MKLNKENIAKMTSIYVAKTTEKKLNSLFNLSSTKSENVKSMSALLRLLFRQNDGNIIYSTVKIGRKKSDFSRGNNMDEGFKPSDLWTYEQLSLVAEIVNLVRNDITCSYVNYDNYCCFYFVKREFLNPRGLVEVITEKKIVDKNYTTFSGTYTKKVEIESKVERQILNFDSLKYVKSIYENVLREQKAEAEAKKQAEQLKKVATKK